MIVYQGVCRRGNNAAQALSGIETVDEPAQELWLHRILVPSPQNNNPENLQNYNQKSYNNFKKNTQPLFNSLCSSLKKSEDFNQRFCEGAGISSDTFFDPSQEIAELIEIITPSSKYQQQMENTQKRFLSASNRESSLQVSPDACRTEASEARAQKPGPEINSTVQSNKTIECLGSVEAESTASKREKALTETSNLLPSYFKPGPYSVIIGRGKVTKGAIGNQRLRVLASTFLTRYSDAANKAGKSKIVAKIVSMIREACPLGAFIRAGKDGRWYDVKDSVAMEKVGYTLRELLGDRYTSSSQSKAMLRRCAVERDGEDPSSPVESSTKTNMNQP